MFYFFFEARHNPSRAPLVIWMTGGPGCSSELAILYENGPFNLDKEGVLSESAYGWDQYHDMIFVDQPVGTGFSYSEDDRDRVYGEDGVANDMLDFVYEFLEMHDDLKDRPLFITGESYAGHYVPAVSHRIWRANKDMEGPHIHLQGLAVGNGLTDPAIQFNAYGDYAVENELISYPLRAAMSFFYPLCGLATNLCQGTGWDLPCLLGLQYCMATQFQPILSVNPSINVYDITRECEGRLCYDFSAADEFLNDPQTRKMLGVGDRLWVSCAMDVYEDMSSDWLTKYDDILPEMMADGIRVMIYAGDLDLICNYLGNRR
ncbi:Alpha/Beta hydrolase protein [Dunaliella salina]|uniref:Carboxypeptidase n=1 Tax=Dunaliella salina TaxID=3046 RepID=A0ABQ7GQ17_DUNSA|nr:Alpha/Beta hydrolase protein [Dunaliella salina]|eukprot:KAF5836700.1 Alpha/Beta hydrolase protein [Dunaliella salina]